MGGIHLPVQLTNFIGRERELAEVSKLLSTARLITIAGPGGCGKTRLALKAAEVAGSGFEDGIWFVELESLDDPALVPQLIIQTLKIPLKAEKPAIETLAQFLQRSLSKRWPNCTAPFSTSVRTRHLNPLSCA